MVYSFPVVIKWILQVPVSGICIFVSRNHLPSFLQVSRSIPLLACFLLYQIEKACAHRHTPFV